MRSPLLLLLGSWSVSIGASAQDLPPTEQTSPIETVTTPAGETIEPGARGAEFPLENRGTGMRGAIDRLDQDVPLPIPARYAAGPGGDRVIREASGDPYFLGFAAGPYTPPADERLDPELLLQLQRRKADGRAREEVYGYVMLAKRVSEALVEELRDFGVRPFGFQPHHALAAAIRVESLHALSAHPAVRWVGAARTWQKTSPRLQARLIEARPEDVLELWINVFESDLGAESTSRALGVLRIGDPGVPERILYDESQLAKSWMSNGWQQRALERAGFGIIEYVDSVRAFRVQGTPESIARALGLDFVVFVEPYLEPEALHDESMPLISADGVRASYGGGTSGVATVGVIDSGLDATHPAFAGVSYVGWDYTGGGFGPTPGTGVDDCGHGTHVTGTLLGRGWTGSSSLAGVAPQAGGQPNQRLRYVDIFGPGACAASPCCNTSRTSMNALFYHHAVAFTDPQGLVTPPSLVVNNSWGSSTCAGSPCIGPCVPYGGTDNASRAVDAVVFSDRLFLVFAAGNDGACSFSGMINEPAVAKNAFTVGSVRDTSNAAQLSTFSARGPAADSRWKPNVVAPGEVITSAWASSNGGTVTRSGTSMAAPHVSGVALQLCDRYEFLRRAPERLAAVLMGTAQISGGFYTLTDPAVDQLVLNQVGAGLVDAMLAGSQFSWRQNQNWGFEMSRSSGFQFDDFIVPAGTQRLVVCMTYHEDASLAGASRAVENDLDLILDRDPIDPGGRTGEYLSQISAIDNTEIRYVDAPAAGLWRWKVYPTTVYSNTKVSVNVVMLQAPVVSAVAIALSGQPWAKTGTFDIGVDVEPVAGTASAVNLSMTARAGIFSPRPHVGATSLLLDGILVDHMSNATLGQVIELGTIHDGTPRAAAWRFSENQELDLQVDVRANALNGTGSNSFTVRLDRDRPDDPRNLICTSHTAGSSLWSNDPNLVFQWTAGTDTRSGVHGHSTLVNTTSSSLPDESIEIGPGGSATIFFPSSNSGQYLHLRTVDRAGWGSLSGASIGPFRIDATPPTLPAISSASHQVNVWSNLAVVSFNVTPATDQHSGLDGYSMVFDTAPGVLPPTTLNRANITSISFPVGQSGRYYLKVRTRDNAGNWTPGMLQIGPYFIDIVRPPAPANLTAPNHQVNNWSTNEMLDLSWTAPQDLESGVRGYGLATGATAGVVVPTTQVLGHVTSTTVQLSTSTSPWYVALRTMDLANNWSNQNAEIGPFFIDNVPPTMPTVSVTSAHTAGQWSSSTNFIFSVSNVVDQHSGYGGCEYVFDFSSSTLVNPGQPGTSITTNRSVPLSASANGWWLHVASRDIAGNYSPTSHFGPFFIDNQNPGAPTGFACTSHPVGGWGSASTFAFTWNPGNDPMSGIRDAILLVDGFTLGIPYLGGTRLGVATSRFLAAPPGGPWYAHLQFQDNAGNYGPVANIGPFYVDSTPPSNVSLNISNGSAQTQSLAVTLTIQATDTGSGLADMRFRNSGGSWSPWMPFAGIENWDLSALGGSSLPGSRTVELEVRDQAQNVASASDTIRYVVMPQVFGAGCAGALGTPNIAVLSIPTAGSSMTITSFPTNAATSSLYLGFSNQSWLGIPLPLDLGLVGVAGCSLHVSPDIAIYSGPNAPVNLLIPGDAYFVGAEVFFQWIHFADPSGRLLVTSPGVRVTVNGL